MNEAEMIAAFNEWMRQYTEDPEGFENDFTTVSRYLKEMGAGDDPAYGLTCTALMLEYRDKLKEAA